MPREHEECSWEQSFNKTGVDWAFWSHTDFRYLCDQFTAVLASPINRTWSSAILMLCGETTCSGASNQVLPKLLVLPQLHQRSETKIQASGNLWRIHVHNPCPCFVRLHPLAFTGLNALLVLILSIQGLFYISDSRWIIITVIIDRALSPAAFLLDHLRTENQRSIKHWSSWSTIDTWMIWVFVLFIYQMNWSGRNPKNLWVFP